MRPTFSSLFIFLFFTLFNGIANAYITLYSWPNLVYTGKTYTIGWSGGDGTPVTVSLLLGGSSSTLTNLGTIWTGTGYSIYWTVGTALKASNYYVIKVTQSGYVDYSDYFTLLESISGTTAVSSSTIKGTSLSSAPSIYTSVSTQISSIPTTVTQVSTVIPTSASSGNSMFNFGGSSTSSNNALFTSGVSSASSLYPTPLSTISISTTSFSTVTPSSCTSPTTTGLISSTDCQGSHLSHTAIIGIIVGAIIAVIAILGGVIMVVRRSMNKHDRTSVPEKTDIASSGPTSASAASALNTDPSPPKVAGYHAAPQYQQQQYPGPGPNIHDQQYPNQYDQQQQYQQSYQPYQQQPPYQQYPNQPYQQQQQGQPLLPPHMQPYPPQQYPPPQHQPYHQTHSTSMEHHELAALHDTKQADMMLSSPTSAISPATTYSNLHNNGPGTSISDRTSEMDTTILPRYEKETPVVSVQAIQPVQQQQQQQQLQQQQPLLPYNGRTLQGQHGVIHELG